MEDLTGKQLGAYQVVEPLGEGGMAAVYKAYQPSIERYVALKILPRHFSTDPEFVQRFKQEARVIANLQHPHILPVHDFGESEGYTYMAMRFIQGGELSSWMKANKPMSLSQIEQIISQIGDALDYAHSQDVIHRDVKPSNVLIDNRGNCLLSDFGLAKIIQTSVKLTRTGGILGTPAYMSPEQGLGQGVDHRSDIYALGVILYEMVTGRPPYQAETPMAILIKHINDPLPPPRHFNPDVPELLEGVVLKALAKDKLDRFSTAGEMVKAVQRAVAQSTNLRSPLPATTIEDSSTSHPDSHTVLNQPAQSIVTDPLEPTKTAVPAPPNRRRGWYIGVGVLLTAVVGFLILSMINDPNDPSDIDPFVGDLPAQVAQVVDQANADWADGDLEAALNGYDAAIDQEPGAYDLYCRRAELLEYTDDLAASIDDYRTCQTIAEHAGDDSTASDAFGFGTVVQMRQLGVEGSDLSTLRGGLDEALTQPLAPDWLYCERGELSLGYADTGAALADFERCIEQVDDDYWSVRSEAVINMIKGSEALEAEEYETAVAYLSRWAELDPAGPWAFCSLGYAYSGLQSFDEAESAFNQCAEIGRSANLPDVVDEAQSGKFYTAAQLAMDEGRFEAAVNPYLRAIELTPDYSWLYCGLGDVYWELDQLRQARTSFEMCLEKADGDQGIIDWADEALAELN